MPTSPPVLGQRDKREQRRAIDQQRGSNAKRGYDWKWRKFRAAYIAAVVVEDPFCQFCHKPFSRERDIEIHHEKKLSEFPELKYDRENLKYACKKCHSRLTAQGL